MRYIIIFLVLIFSTIRLEAFVSVGITAGQNCTYLTIQEALDDGDAEIRVVSGIDFVENIDIDHSVTIRGGFGTCFAAALNSQGSANSVIDGSAVLGFAAINVASLNRINIVLDKLNIKNAVDTILGDGGHGIDLNDTAGSLKLTNSVVIGNTAENGGGIYSSSPFTSQVIILENSSVFGNTASVDGGGIYCSSSTVTISVAKGSLVGENMATNGGGIAAFNGCKVIVDSGVDTFNSLDLRGVMGNTASNNGGGIYLDDSELGLEGNLYGLVQVGNNTDPVTVSNNRALNDGGGIYALNDSTIDITDGLITDNSSTGHGGGIYLLSSTLTMDFARSNCWQPQKCSIIANNVTGNNKFGGALYSKTDSTINVYRTHIYDNRAALGAVLYALDLDSAINTEVILDGNYIYNNSDDGLDGYADEFIFRGFGFVNLSLIHNTIVDNDISDSSSIIGIDGNVMLNVRNSIIDNENETILTTNGAGNITNSSCLLVNENTSIFGTLISIFALVGYVDRVNHDYHLGPLALGRDKCVSQSGFALNYDADNQDRGFDDPTISNLSGTYDMGADEYVFIENVFANSFE